MLRRGSGPLPRLFLAFLLLAACSASAGVQSWTTDRRVQELAKLVERDGVVIELNQRQYRDFVLEPRRKHTIVMLFTAKSSECKQCREIMVTFNKTAEAYRAHGLMNSKVPEERTRPVFFAAIDLMTYPSIAVVHQFEAVPFVAVITPSLVFTKGPPIEPTGESALVYPMASLMTNFISQTDNTLLEFINSNSGELDIAFAVSFEASATRILFIFASWCLIAFVAWKAFIWSRNSPRFMATGATIIFWLATSGLCWSVLNGAPFYYTDPKTGAHSIFFMGESRQRRVQSIWESLIMASLVMAAGSCIVFAAHVLRFNTLKWRRVSNCFSIVLLLAALGLFKLIMAIHTWKMGFRDPGLWPPPDYVRGPLWTDRGNNL